MSEAKAPDGRGLLFRVLENEIPQLKHSDAWMHLQSAVARVYQRLEEAQTPLTPPAHVETDINKRWGQGIDHHPKSVALFRSLEQIDLKYGGDYFYWKSGGDGDNGEHLMYELDIHFETLDAAQAELSKLAGSPHG